VTFNLYSNFQSAQSWAQRDFSDSQMAPKNSISVENHNEKVTPEFACKFRADLRALLLKNLEASPSFRRICRQALGLPRANSNQFKNLAKNDFIFRGQDSMPSDKLEAPQTDVFKNVRHCQHIKVTGVPCGGPAMRGEQFCYFHQRLLRGVKIPPRSRIHPIAMIEDEESIQVSLMEIINALARNYIDPRRADIMVRALNIAVKNSRRAKFNIGNSEMVREVPDYPAPPKPAPPPERVLEEEAQWIKERKAKDGHAQVLSRALATIPVPVAAKPVVAKPAPAPVLVAATSAPAKNIVTQQVTSEERFPVDPTQRKPPARGNPDHNKTSGSESEQNTHMKRPDSKLDPVL
jgi:hypothetical protein